MILSGLMAEKSKCGHCGGYRCCKGNTLVATVDVQKSLLQNM